METTWEQAGAIPWRRGPGGGVEVLFVTSLRSRKWIVPKGLIEPDLGPIRSALGEAWEEGGVRGEIDGGPVGTYTQRKWGGVCRIALYPMAVTEVCDRWPEQGERERRWVPFEEAGQVAGPDGLARIFDDLAVEDLIRSADRT